MDEDLEQGGPKKDEGGGAPKWMTTFADLMSLLLAFFVLLFSFSSIDDQKYQEVGGSMKEAFGVQRLQVILDRIMGINHIATEFSAGRPDLRVLNLIPEELLIVNISYDTPQDTEGREDEKDDSVDFARKPGRSSEALDFSGTRDPGTEIGGAIADAEGDTAQIVPEKVGEQEGLRSDGREKQTQRIPRGKSTERLRKEAVSDHLVAMIGRELADDLREGRVEFELQGDKIIFRIDESWSFPSGSAELLPTYQGVLGRVGEVLSNTEGKIQVAGHTDSDPISSARFRSNWELSTSRAVSVAHALMDQAIADPDRFEVQGFADTVPLESNETPEGKARNRRVEIVVSTPFDPAEAEAMHRQKMEEYMKNQPLGEVDDEGRPVFDEDFLTSMRRLEGLAGPGSVAPRSGFDPIFHNHLYH